MKKANELLKEAGYIVSNKSRSEVRIWIEIMYTMNTQIVYVMNV